MVSTAKASMAFSFDNMLLLLDLTMFTLMIMVLKSNANTYFMVF
uniref:Uncharacterized protein n=1 Tax=uncultured gamma proteobacterium HF0500_07A21 TaxID=723573 RepID=E7C4W2_9GAMM|nr:hypothetical protein [uncultured gamma proteobacterium HF0500_07A21]